MPDNPFRYGTRFAAHRLLPLLGSVWIRIPADMRMRSPIYWNPTLYHLAIRQSAGKFFAQRYLALDELIPEHASVTEVCMGDAYLYRNYLARKQVAYLGLDINNSFVRSAIRKDIPARTFDVMSDALEPADYVIMQGSLYQFIPEEKKIIRKLLNAARKQLLISEPVRNRAQSNNPFISFLAKHAVNPGTGHATERFTEKTLVECFQCFPEFKEARTIDGGIDMIGIFERTRVETSGQTNP